MRDRRVTGDTPPALMGVKRDKPPPALNNITAKVREREEPNRTREAGHLDEIQGVVVNTRNLLRNGAVGFIEWLDGERA